MYACDSLNNFWPISCGCACVWALRRFVFVPFLLWSPPLDSVYSGKRKKKKNKTLALPLTHMAALYSLCLYVCMQQQGHGHGKERFCCTPRCSIASVYACEQLSIGNKLVKCTTLWFTTGGKTQFCIQAAFRLLPAGVCVPLCLNALITTAKRRKGHFFPA